jgi:hypothetical protein
MLDELKQKAADLIGKAKEVGSGSVNVAKGLTGSKEVAQIHEMLQRKTKGLNYFREDDGK